LAAIVSLAAGFMARTLNAMPLHPDRGRVCGYRLHNASILIS